MHKVSGYIKCWLRLVSFEELTTRISCIERFNSLVISFTGRAAKTHETVQQVNLLAWISTISLRILLTLLLMTLPTILQTISRIHIPTYLQKPYYEITM